MNPKAAGSGVGKTESDSNPYSPRLREIAGRIEGLSYREMQQFATLLSEKVAIVALSECSGANMAEALLVTAKVIEDGVIA